MEDLLKNPFMKSAAERLLDVIAISIIFTSLVMGTDARGQTRKKVPEQTGASFSYEDHRKACLKKRSEKRCNMLIEARKNLDDAKKKALITQ